MCLHVSKLDIPRLDIGMKQLTLVKYFPFFPIASFNFPCLSEARSQAFFDSQDHDQQLLNQFHRISQLSLLDHPGQLSFRLHGHGHGFVIIAMHS